MWKTYVEKTVTMNYETSTGDKGQGARKIRWFENEIGNRRKKKKRKTEDFGLKVSSTWQN